MSASTTAGPRADQENPQSQGSGRRLLTVLGPFIGLALVILLFSIPPQIRPTFLSLDNFRDVATQTVIVALGALGMTLIIISGGIDLSVGSVLALTSVVAALVLDGGIPDVTPAAPVHPPVLALLAAVLAGGLVGVLNGSLITGLKVTPFIVTLGTLGIARGVASWLARETAVNAPGAWLRDLAATSPHPQWLLVSPGVWIALALAVLTAVILRATTLGRYIFAIGGNETAARLSGLRVDALKVAIYGVAGLFFGLGGVLQYGRLGQGDPTVDIGRELDVIAAVVIGGASLSGGEGSVLGSVVGALIMSVLRNGSQQMGWPAYVQQIIIGVVIIAAVALDRLRHAAPDAK
ncbi:MAG: ABC transporter permease [Armatimonadetes bacterium]|nr:ABC transporter permease [Armatimonadota bacterium]